ncbi:MAG TPA: hypothetical protein VD862_01465 [Candidatus Paceibacterota bacterium]|nr:hypothetical protein [Candidatus Paceibacterota bacterium]
MANVLNLKEFPSDVGGEQESVGGAPATGPVPDGADSPEPRASSLLAGFFGEDREPESVSWRAPVLPDALERRKEHILLGILGSAAVGVAVWQGSWTLFFVALLTVVTWEVHHRVHTESEVTIDAAGITVNGHRHRYERLATFAIQEMPDGSRHLSVASASGMVPAIRAPLGEQNHEEVRDVLQQFLPETEHPIPISELFLKS